MKRSILGLTMCALAGSGVLAEPTAGAIIGKITIEADDIFNTQNPSENGWLYRTANVLHIQTRQSVIRRELLFKEGDVYNPDLIAETERNIRRFGFLRRVHITTEDAPGGKVNVTVHTKDTWTLEPQADFNRVGNQSSSKFGLVERNLLGEGKRVSVFHNNLPEGSHNSFAYRDQQFLGTHMTLDGEYLHGTDFREYGASLSKPFRSTLTQYSFELSDYFNEEELMQYQDGHEVGRFEKESREANIVLGRSFNSTTKATKQGSLALKQQTKMFAPLSGDNTSYLRTPIDLTLIEAGYAWQQIDFVKEKHIEKFDRDEDFNLGTGLGASFGVGHDWANNNRFQFVPQLSGQTAWKFNEGHFALASMKYRSRISRDTTDNLSLNTDVQYFNRLTRNNTLAAHFSYDHGYRLDPDERYLLGEDTGLHAYSVGQFSGDRRVLFNLEDRLFFAEDVLHLVSLGGAVFFDSGYAWGSSENVSLSDLKNVVGLSFRVAMSRSSRNEPIRLDIAYALNDNQQDSRLVVSARSGVKFGGESEKRSRL